MFAVAVALATVHAVVSSALAGGGMSVVELCCRAGGLDTCVRGTVRTWQVIRSPVGHTKAYVAP